MEKINILFIFILIHFISSDDYQDKWRDYPACRLGRMQSPIEINEYKRVIQMISLLFIKTIKKLRMLIHSNSRMKMTIMLLLQIFLKEDI